MSVVVEKPAAPPATTLVVLTGNPNCGKTTLFNALTGLRGRVGNYAGVTVERKEGKLLGSPRDLSIGVLDLPGTYSLSPQSPDEQISRDVLFQRLAEVPAPSLVVVVVDCSNLERNLYYATQVIELGYPTLLALNMTDVAQANGHLVDAERLSSALGVPVVSMTANTGGGVEGLKEKIISHARSATRRSIPRTFCELPQAFGSELDRLASLLGQTFQQRTTSAQAEALLLVSDERMLQHSATYYPEAIRKVVLEIRQGLEKSGVDWRSVAIEARYARIAAIQQAVVVEEDIFQETFSDRLDRILTHRIWGVSIFVGIMALMFLSIFTLAKYPMDGLQLLVGWVGNQVGNLIPPGDLQSLVVKGGIEGVGAVVVFVPQICLLFLFIGLLEDTGYMSRAAFLMDRLMSRVGLHGKSFIPMLSSFACAIPGIMATRTIETPRDRLVTILVAPLMSCSARLPVYTLLIAACFPDRKFLASMIMLAMYLLGIVMALVMAWIFKRTLLRGETPMLIMELPPYKRPVVKVVLRHMWDRAKLFLKRAGTVILGINILLWFLSTYPRDPKLTEEFALKKQAAQEMTLPAGADPKALAPAREKAVSALDQEEEARQLPYSMAGRLGHWIEPAIAPLGFDWKMGIGIVSSFAAREVFVSTMSIVYNVAQGEDEEAYNRTLSQTLQEQKRPDGTRVYTTLTCVTLMVFYVLAMQCVSTVVVVRRETNTWKWPLFQWVYMGALAWVMAFLTYHGGKWLGWG